jgi:tetratricopeptide (TPR) repeat protein/cellulose synthase/poly-beta-1,6-N-acetylglucosamine synthase-like glycosyltransferase
LPDKQHFVIPNIHAVDDSPPVPDGREGMVFVGNFNHPPNADAVKYFVKEIFPLVKQRIPGIGFTIVGNNPPEEILAFRSKSITVTGYVPSTEPYLKSARVSVAPLRYGAGMKGKIGEAMACGLPVVTTSMGSEGMGLVPDETALIADAPHEFAERIVRLCTDDAFWQKIARNGRDFIREHYSKDGVGRQLQCMIEALSPSGHPGLVDVSCNVGKDPVKGLTSIVVLTFNELEYTKQCVESVMKRTPERHEIIFVDNGSSDGTVKWLKELTQKHPDYKLIGNPTNLGFAKGCNQGMQMSSGEYILLLNNDAVVTEGWLSGMLECLESGPETGIVGPMTNYISGVQKDLFADYGSIDHLGKYAGNFRERNRYRRVPVRRVAGFCMLFRRSLIGKIGALDESFGSGNYEDDDFCLRSVLEGHRNLIAGDVFIHHYGNRSFVGNGIDYSSAMLGNRKIFSKKWSCIDVDGRLAKDLMAANAVENACNFRQKGMVHEAVEEFLKGIKYSPLDGNIYFSLAEMLIDEKRFKDASDLLERMPSAGNRSKRAALNGYCKEGMELYDEAGQYADIALSLEKNNPSAFNLKGVLAYKYGERAEAERLFSEAIKCDPSFGEPYTNLGVLRWAAGLKEEAVPLAEKGFVLYPYINDIATIYHSMITALEDYERGEKRFREAKSLCPLNRKIAFFLVDILIRQGKNEEAIEDIEDAMLVFGMDDGIISAALKVREKAGPKEIKKQGSRIQGFKGSSGEAETLPSKSRFSDSISLCMIVKNEEKYLARCLWSVRDLVGEMIVVDTGSGDRTKDIARIFGAKVYDFGWTNDFSEARNFSLSKASGDWIMVLDADEVISPEDHDALALIMRRKSGKTAAYSLVTRNYVRDMAVTGWTPNDGRYAEEAGSGWFPSEKVRLFRNDRRIRFDNPVHELVEFSLARARIKVKKCSVPVHHYGKMDSEKVLSKGEDYYLLGKKKLEEKAGDLQALFELAVQATELKRYDDAVELWQMVIDFRGGVPPESLSRAYLNIGAVHLERGRYEEALLSSRKAMDLNPHMKGAAMNYALSELCAGDIQNVIPVLEGLLQAEPEYLPALRMLFAVLCIDGRSQQRRDCLEKIKRAGADCSACCHHYARHLVSAGRAEQAMVLLNAAIESNNSNEDILNLLSECCGMYDRGQCTVESKSEAAQAHFNLARACRERGDLDKAAAGFLKAVNIKQDYAEAYNYLGNTVTLQGRLEAAEACYREAININSGYVEAFYNLGNVLCLMKRHEEAVRSYQKAIGLMPDFPEAYYKLGQSLCSLGRHDEAVMNYERALELNPEFAEAYNAIGNALRESGKPEEAIGSYGEALKLNPDFAEVYYNISNICLDAGDVEGALQNCRRSLAINPDLPDAHWNMALALLTKGDLKPGWANYGWRFLKKDAPPVPVKYPSWDGSYLRGKTLLVYAEQGVGDEIMFASCLPDVLSRVDACVLECDARLVPLFSRSFPEVRTIGRVKTKDDNAPEGLPPVDVQIAIGSLPEFFRASVGGFPDRQAYLVPDCRKAEGWRDRFKSLGAGLKIGISWRGGRELCVKKMRSTVLDQWSGLFSVPGVSFINLQYGDSKEELRRVREETGARIYDWEDADPLMDLDNFAAQIAALDLVISVDNSTVHMAGALGVPVWTMLPLGCDWRWMTRYEDTPWYPFMRLFRQKYPGDWESVFADVVKRLQEIASAGAVFPIESALSYRSFHCRDMSGSMILSG